MEDFPKNYFWPLLLTGVSYEGNFNILKALFGDIPLAYSFCTSGGQVAGATKKIGKWGILEKSFQNVVQLPLFYLHRTLSLNIMHKH